jgi:hypothetical protein
MASMTSAPGNMGTQQFGSVLLISLIICHWLRLLKEGYCACMADCHLRSTSWTRYTISTDEWNHQQKGLCAIYYGQIRMKEPGGG